MNNYKFKIVIFILLFISLIVALFYGIFGFSLSYLSETEIKEGRKLKEDLINSFKINNVDTIYDKSNNIYYYSLPENYEKQKYTLKLELDSQFKYKFVDYATNIVTVNYNKEYNVLIYNDNYYYETTIRLTNLPLISLTTDTIITDNDTNAVFKYINPSNLDVVMTYNSKIHVRGATSKNYDKKSYKLNIYDNNFEKEKSINISNFYYGSAFILDALYRDDSKIRNAFATELWNYFSSDFTKVEEYGEFVEVFINNEYVGLYLFMEPINRKNLNLNKSSLNDTSVVVKSGDWELPSFNDYFNVMDDVYYTYELKYPNDQELFNASWNSVFDKLSKYYIDGTGSSYELLDETFNLNNYIDLVLFNSFINNEDNGFIKNNYFYQKSLNDKIYIQPWDMEFSFGLSYSARLKNNVEKTLNDYDEIIFDLKHSSDKVNNLIINRYWNLRNSVLTEQNLDKILDDYREKLNKGSAKRDSDNWNNNDVEVEIEDIRTWLHNRLKFFDSYIRGLKNE